MYDIHHHLLPGLDDGPPTLAEAVAQARLAEADGITHVVCTPHASSYFSFDPEIVAARIAELRAALLSAGIGLTLGSGCDFHVSFDNVQLAIDNPRRFAINGGPYLLLELPDHGLSPNLSQTWYDLQLAGLTLILTHPERNPTLQREPSRLAPWLRQGMLIQVTAASVLGQMGKPAFRMANDLLAKRWVHFIASDAHDTARRPPRMSAAHAAVSQRQGTDYADLICTKNPGAVFRGEQMPEQPEPRGLYTAWEPPLPWWKRLFRGHADDEEETG